MVDAANLCCFVRAADLDLTGVEMPAALDGNAEALAKLEAVRSAAGKAAGLDPVPSGIPKVGMVAPPTPFDTLAGDRLAAADMDFTARMVSVGRPHRAVPLTAALCLGVAARMQGTLVHEANRSSDGAETRIGHPSGIALVAAEVSGNGATAHAERAVVYRTARRLMDGFVYAPGR